MSFSHELNFKKTAENFCRAIENDVLILADKMERLDHDYHTHTIEPTPELSAWREGLNNGKQRSFTLNESTGEVTYLADPLMLYPPYAQYLQISIPDVNPLMNRSVKLYYDR